jgi:hypothetical protein
MSARADAQRESLGRLTTIIDHTQRLIAAAERSFWDATIIAACRLADELDEMRLTLLGIEPDVALQSASPTLAPRVRLKDAVERLVGDLDNSAAELLLPPVFAATAGPPARWRGCVRNELRWLPRLVHHRPGTPDIVSLRSWRFAAERLRSRMAEFLSLPVEPATATPEPAMVAHQSSAMGPTDSAIPSNAIRSTQAALARFLGVTNRGSLAPKLQQEGLHDWYGWHGSALWVVLHNSQDHERFACEQSQNPDLRNKRSDGH